MPARLLELFQETLQGGSDTSPRAAGMQRRSTQEEKTKDEALTTTTTTTAFARYWSAFACVCFSVINFFLFLFVFEWQQMSRQLCGASLVHEHVCQQSDVNTFHKHVHVHVVCCKSSTHISIYLCLFRCCRIRLSFTCLTTNAKSNIHHETMPFLERNDTQSFLM